MSANSFWQDVKSQIPILKSGQNEQKEKKLETSGRKWNDKLKKRSSSALSIFQVTHKVPSHIVCPKSSKEADSQLQNWKESRQYNSNMELSRCLDSFSGIAPKSERVRPSPHNTSHGSAQDLTMTWWQKKPPTKSTTNTNMLCDSKEKSASIANIFYEKENDENSTFYQNNGAPVSLPGVGGLENGYNGSFHTLPKSMNFPYQPTLTSNRGMRKQFLSEQNLLDASSSQTEYGLHSLDHSYLYKGMYNKMSFDISTIKELPEDRSDSPVRPLDDDAVNTEISDHERKTCTSLSPSYADTYRSLQNLCMDVFDGQRHTSLTENNMANPPAFLNSDHSYKPSKVDNSCFRSVQDLRDSSILEDASHLSMDYTFMNSGLHSGSPKFLNDSVKPAGMTEATCFDYWVDNDRSVSMMDITEIGAHRKDLSRKNPSRIPKRRHTMSAHNLDGLSLSFLGSSESSSRLNVAQQPEAKTGGKASSEMSARLKNNASSVAKPTCCKKAPALERKKGCVGCQQKRHQVARQNSMPLLKNGATRDKRAEGRKPLNRSCSNPGPASRKSQVQEMQQKKAEKINESTSNYTQEMSTSRSEVERLREEVHNHKRIIRQLSLRLPHESYKENQPLSLGHIPSTSVDNVFEAFLRPCRPRRDSSEAELQELVSELRAENKNLRSELQESRDQADLLEFRVLELTEGSDRFSEAEKATFIRDSEDKAEPPQLINFEDLSLPLSIDSGLDLTADGKRARCSAIELTAVTKSEDLLSSECRPTVQSLCTPDSEKSEASSSASGQASPDQSDEKQPDTAVYDASKQQEPEHTTDPADLPDIISNLQHYLDRPDRLQASLLATVEKLSSLTSSVSDLETKVSSMSRENQYLTDTLSSLNEAQETRTEASGTESEIVSRKTPSLHSDLSDSDSDSSSAADSSVAKKRFETLSNFQESGIFEGSSDVVHAASQTEDDGQVTTQAEESERLHSENARLVEALEELRRNYDQLLQNSANKCPRCVEGAEVDRGESRALKEQLRVSQGARKALYEEKCELEEAENDARLMVQRLDSQLTAAREMELLLSASLSQEQEISRELHKKVKELQYLQAAEKERSYRQSLMEKESIDEGAVSLILDKDTYASQLEFVKHSLILLHVFRHFHLLNSWLSADGGCEAPTEGLETVDEYVHGSNALVTRDGFERSHRDIDDALTEITSDQIVASQSSLKSPVAAELNFSSSFLSLDEMIDQHPKFSEFLIPGFADISVQTEPVELGAEFPGVQNKPESSCSQEPGDFKDFPNKSSAMNKVDVQSKSTMTVEKDLLSLRESFYLEQIEALQEEKSALRKESDQERSVAVEREGLLQGTVQDLQAQLLDCERARAALQCEIELQKEKEETLSKDFHKYMEQSRNDQARASELHEMEKAALRRDFEARIAEVMEDRRRHSDRCDELEHQLSALWRELECSQEAPETASYEGMPHAAATTGGEDSDQPASQRPSDAARLGCSSNMLDTIRLLVKSERSLRSKVTELEEKESAYRETIQEADQIMLSHVTSYKQRIDELEAANERCEAKVRQLECSEDRMRSSLKSNARCEQDIRVAELLEQLLTIERSELELKHKLWNIEKSEKELKIKVIEGEKVQESLRGELRDQDDLVRKMHSLQSENSAIGQQLQRAHESVRRAVDKQQTESLLKGRVEELEYSENALKNTLQQTYAAHALKERRLNQQVAALEEEVSSLKKRIENASIKEAQILESEVTLKRHVEALRAELQDAKRDLKMFSADECSSRTEVSRLRSQLKQANGDLTEAESINCSLRERLAASEQLKETLERSLEERKRRHESDLLQLNLQASQRESRLEETEGQLCELTQLHAAQELDLLAASPLEPLVRTTRRLTAQLCLCDACSQTHGTTIADLNAQLDTLTDLLSGAQHQDDSDGEEDGDQTLRSSDETTEKGADTNALTSVSDESVRYSSSSEGYGSNTISDVSTPLDENQHNRTGDSPRSGSPAPIPAPRRKRKLKRDFASSLRSSLKNRKKGGNTILEELEEKVRELEESINTKDEELKLADSEATDLSSKLAAAQDIAVNKEAEVAVIRQNMSELQRQLALSFENNEITKRNFELMYKEEQDKVQQQVERLGHQLNELQCRACVKDSIISALVANIRAFIKTCNVEVIIGQITSLREKMEQRRQRTENKVQSTTNNTSDEGDEDVPDHDVHTVCEMLGRPLEVLVPSSLDSPATSGPFSTQTADSAVQTGDALSAPLMVHRQIQTVFEPCLSEPFSTPVNTSLLIHEPASFLKTDEHNLTNPSPNGRITADSGPSDSSDSSSSAVEKSNVTLNRSLPSVHQSTQTSPSHFHKVGPHQKSLIPKIVKPQNAHLKSEVRRAISFNSKLSSMARGVAVQSSRSPAKMSQPNLRCSAVSPKISCNYPTEPDTRRQRTTGPPLVEPSNVVPPSRVQSPTARAGTRTSFQAEEKDFNLSAQASSRSSQPSDEPNHHICKKMKGSVVPQERSKSSWQTVRRISRTFSAALSGSCETKGSNFIPRPSDLKITRWVGKDGVVIAWAQQNHDGVVGFQVIVAGKVVQSIRSPKRTKALITGLSPTSSVSIGLVSVGADGRCSKPAVVICDRSKTSLTMN